MKISTILFRLALVAAAVAIVAAIPDVKRYIRISTM
jgi:hypothetical protein